MKLCDPNSDHVRFSSFNCLALTKHFDRFGDFYEQK